MNIEEIVKHATPTNKNKRPPKKGYDNVCFDSTDESTEEGKKDKEKAKDKDAKGQRKAKEDKNIETSTFCPVVNSKEGTRPQQQSSDNKDNKDDSHSPPKEEIKKQEAKMKKNKAEEVKKLDSKAKKAKSKRPKEDNNKLSAEPSKVSPMCDSDDDAVPNFKVKQMTKDSPENNNKAKETKEREKERAGDDEVKKPELRTRKTRATNSMTKKPKEDDNLKVSPDSDDDGYFKIKVPQKRSVRKKTTSGGTPSAGNARRNPSKRREDKDKR